MRLIDADTLSEVFGIGRDCAHCQLGRQKCEEDFISTIEICGTIAEEPTVDPVKVKRGRWINDRLLSTGGGDYLIKRCSECRNYWYAGMSGGWSYCPKCGSRMDEVTE